MQTVYEPKGKAKEYGDLALNIYTGCPHGCIYCYVPTILRKDRPAFHSCVEPRKNIVEETNKMLAKGIVTVIDKVKNEQGETISIKRIIELKGKLIHLNFTCDPFPKGYDHESTYVIIEAIKTSGNHVQILTKGSPDMQRLIKLLDKNDKFGVTISGYPYRSSETTEPNALPVGCRLDLVKTAKANNISTFISFEPVYDKDVVYNLIRNVDYIDEYRIGKLNYASSDIDWAEFGRKCEELCIKHGRKYMIKEGLRAEMNKQGGTKCLNHLNN